jgi:hypothetical protein
LAAVEIVKLLEGGYNLKKLKGFYFCTLVLILLLFSPLRMIAEAGESISPDVIRQARLRGELDDETALVYRVWAVMDPERLPPKFSGRPRGLVKSLTPLFLEVRSRWDELRPQAKAALVPYLLRPTEPGQEPFLYGHSYSVPAVYHDSPGGHLRIWYVTSTDDSPDLVYTYGDTIPDWIHICAEVFDHVWETEVNSLGYRSPPADGSWYGQEDYGGDSRYDIYVEDLNRHRVYGYAMSEFNTPGVAPRAYTSYIVVDNDYSSTLYPTSGEDGLMVTAAHEFFHAIQFAYDTLEERFFMEISSTWMEDVVYDAINDYYNYLSHSGHSSIFSRPELSLTTFDGFYEYSSCVWGHYLCRRFDRLIMREIWEGCVQQAALEAMDEALNVRGSDLASAHNEFAIWNYFTGSRADTALYYPEGDRYPQVKIYSDNLHPSYPVEMDSVSHPAQPLGASYVCFLTQDTPGGLRVELNGRPEVTWNAALLGVGPPHEVVQIPLDGFGHGQGQMFNWSGYEQVALVVTPFALSGSSVQYAYQAMPDSNLIGPDQFVTALGQNYPSPVAGDRTVIPFSIARGGEVSMRIFTLEGQLVRRFDWGYLDPGQYYGPDRGRGDWDLTNAADELVAAGVYLYQLRLGDRVETRKMVLVR